MAILVQDTYIRSASAGNTAIANAAGWGTASDGHTWTQAGGSPTWSILGNQGKVTGTSADTYAFLNATTYTDSEGLVRISSSSQNSGNWQGITLRYTNASNKYYGILVINGTSGTLYLRKTVAGVDSSINAATPITITSNTEYYLRFRAKGTTLSLKYWASTAAEPSSWTMTNTDSSLASGQSGLYISPDASGTVTLFDTFQINDTTIGTVISGVRNCYVSPTGSDLTGDGSATYPWATLIKAAGSLSGAELVHVANGAYTLTDSSGNIQIYAGGTDDTHRTVFLADTIGGASIINTITPVNSNISDPAIFLGGNFIDITGFDISGAAGRVGIFSEGQSGVGSGSPAGSHNRVRQCVVHDLGTSVSTSYNVSGIEFGQYNHTPGYVANYNEVSRCVVRNVGQVGITGSHGIYFGTGHGTIQNNIVSGVPGFGIRSFHFANHETINNNLVFNCGSNAPAGGDGLIAGGGIYLSAGGALWVQGSDDPCDFCTVTNNVMIDCIGYGGLYEYAGGQVGPTLIAQVVANNSFSNNAYWNVNGSVASPAECDSGAFNVNAVLVSPLMVDYRKDGTGDYHILANSVYVDGGISTGAPAIDFDGVLRPQGIRYDIGPYENSYGHYKVYVEPNLLAALTANSLLNNVQVIGPDTTSTHDDWVEQSSIDLASSLSGYVRHAFPTNATDISNDSREVAARSLVSAVYTNDPTNKPIMQGEMGFGYAGPGQSVTLYQYGVDMADYAVQLARAGMAALIVYDLDDDMHGTEWGFWQITQDTGKPRPWFFPWSLLCNTLVIGSTLYAPAQPASNDFRCLAATSPQGFWTIVLINRKSIAQNVQVIVPFAPVVTTSMQVFTYSQATPLLVDSNGFPLASGTLTVVLQRGFTTSIAANSVLILTQNAPSSSAPPPVGPGLPQPPPIGPTTISTIDVKRPPLEKRR